MKALGSTILLAHCVLFVRSDRDLIQPFRVEFDDFAVKELHLRLNLTRWPDELEDVAASTSIEDRWSYGAPLQVVKDLARYWVEEFDWEQQTNILNAMPQFTTELGEHTVHFVHKRSQRKDAVPLLIVHGWPGSFYECHKVLSLYTDPPKDAPAFHVVCPSIPGYGFSSKPKTKGFDQKAAADLFEALMLRLGYNLYMLQGGDWGSVVTSLMADSPNAPARVIGLHLNMVPIAAPFRKGVGGLLSTLASFVLPWWFYSAEERAGLLRMPLYTIKETGYFHEQSTRPQTLSYGLADSPVALLSWVVEKFYAWGDVDTDARRGGEDGADGGDTAAEILYGRFSRDELLTNIMLYWLPNKGGSSVRFYYEMWNGPGAVFDRLSALDVKVPTAVAAFPKEITTPVQYWASWFYNIKRWTLMPKGGHFAMLEEPEALVQDVQAFAVQITAGATMASDAWAESGNGNQHREL